MIHVRRVLRNNSKIRFHQYCWCFRGSIPISVLHLSIDYLSQHDHQNSISQETKKNALTCGVSDFFIEQVTIFLYRDRNCLVICDRGVMDASAFISRKQWETILTRNGLEEEEIRDNRYNQVVHMVSAANGAENFYR